MVLPSLRQLKDDVYRAERAVTNARKLHGRESAEYRAALKKFAVAWFILKKSRSSHEFLHDINQPPRG